VQFNKLSAEAWLSEGNMIFDFLQNHFSFCNSYIIKTCINMHFPKKKEKKILICVHHREVHFVKSVCCYSYNNNNNNNILLPILGPQGAT
jgi:hypothetical protein